MLVQYCDQGPDFVLCVDEGDQIPMRQLAEHALRRVYGTQENRKLLTKEAYYNVRTHSIHINGLRNVAENTAFSMWKIFCRKTNFNYFNSKVNYNLNSIYNTMFSVLHTSPASCKICRRKEMKSWKYPDRL